MLQHLKITWLGHALVASFCLITTTQAALANDDVLVTDPAILEELGFDRDANNVYVASGIDLNDSLNSSSPSTINPDAQAYLFPSGSTDYSPVSPKEFIGRVDTTGSQWLYSAGNSLELSRLGTERFADAQVVDLPNGGVLQFLRWWWADNDPNSVMAIILFEVCQPAFAGGAVTNTVVVINDSFDSPNGSAAISTAARPINTQSCYYLARIRFDAATNLLRFQKVRLQFTHP
ncbi:hypothetical protein ACL7TT_19820 [Microbulbifer sp. 2304DJ12-6]|uniref:hypothetical protein n=1 Tax=Microbulbifer sp. 2304DJ12-6 TaxID=3233340 RepID=UPI0039B0297D